METQIIIWVWPHAIIKEKRILHETQRETSWLR